MKHFYLDKASLLFFSAILLSVLPSPASAAVFNSVKMHTYQNEVVIAQAVSNRIYRVETVYGAGHIFVRAVNDSDTGFEAFYTNKIGSKVGDRVSIQTNPNINNGTSTITNLRTGLSSPVTTTSIATISPTRFKIETVYSDGHIFARSISNKSNGYEIFYSNSIGSSVGNIVSIETNPSVNNGTSTITDLETNQSSPISRKTYIKVAN
ncbi:hypothetical protein V2H45_20585 [Tumidithrix elongata RA019]|uniref:Uncharacterized protein n=1 Tax=Tumidithrix elongata BACA0141 TaxID=2716417 RepID=A0AAW9Q886_9CYAN|nr:hypothetical protein [Tumidithrix elongata RA019]